MVWKYIVFNSGKVWHSSPSSLDGVGLLVTNPPCGNSAPLQISQICQTSLFITTHLEPIMQSFNHFWFRIHVWKNIARIAKHCPENISSVVKVSKCSYKNTLLKFFFFLKMRFVIIYVLSIFEFEFCHTLRIWVLSQFKFLVLSQLEFRDNLIFVNLSFVTVWVWLQFQFCHSLSFWVLSQFVFLSCQNLSF